MSKAFVYAGIISTTLFFSAISSPSCQNNKQNKIIGEKKMEAVIWDLLQADVFAQTYYKADSIKSSTLYIAEMQKKIFQIHGITKQDFDYSYTYYKNNPSVFKNILDSMTTHAEKEKSKAYQDKYSGRRKDTTFSKAVE